MVGTIDRTLFHRRGRLRSGTIALRAASPEYVSATCDTLHGWPRAEDELATYARLKSAASLNKHECYLLALLDSLVTVDMFRAA